MIYSVTFSKPDGAVGDRLGRDYKKLKVTLEASANEATRYFVEMFTKTQVFHKRITPSELDKYIEENAGKTFKNCIVRTENEEITYLANKKGEIKRFSRKVEFANANGFPDSAAGNGKLNGLGSAGNHIFGNNLLAIASDSRKKNYILADGSPIHFLVRLGIMTAEGKVINSKYDKFRQINRFLEFINDVLPLFSDVHSETNSNEPIRILDFGCGKSYLTFAMHYFFSEIKKIPCKIEGLDLKKDVVDYCNRLAAELDLNGIHFSVGNILDYSAEAHPDIVIALHTCDTATDFALKYAVEQKAKVILCVPCCQHEVNKQLQKKGGIAFGGAADGGNFFDGGNALGGNGIVLDGNGNVLGDNGNAFAPLLKWGIVREKFASLVTDAIRAEWLETQGYKVQMLEFIDEEHTPKNILIRAVARCQGKISNNTQEAKNLSKLEAFPVNKSQSEIENLVRALGIFPEILRK